MNTELVLAAIKTVTVALGVAFLYITWRAYRKSPNPGLLILLVAVALMTTAAVAEGLAFQAAGLSLDEAHVIEAIFTLAAFAVFLYSVIGYRVKPQKVKKPVSSIEQPGPGSP